MGLCIHSFRWTHTRVAGTTKTRLGRFLAHGRGLRSSPFLFGRDSSLTLDILLFFTCTKLLYSVQALGDALDMNLNEVVGSPIKAFKTALHNAAPRNAKHLYQCIAAMPDDPCAIVHEMRAVGCLLRLEVVWELCKLYMAVLAVPVVAAMPVPVLDLASMESVGGVQ